VQCDGCHETVACHDFVQGNLRHSLEVGSGPGPAMIVNDQWKRSRKGRGIRVCALG